MTPTPEQSDGVSLRAYVRVVARWKWLVVIVTVVGCAGAYEYSLTRTPMYRAVAQLMYDPQVNIADISSSSYVDPTQRTADLESVNTVIGSLEVGQNARAQLGNYAKVPFGVSAAPQLANDNSGNFTSVVDVTAISPDAHVAALAANVYAQAFVDWRLRREQQRLQQAADVIEGQLGKYTTPVSKLTTDYLALEEQLRNIQILEQTATGDFSVIIKATPPSEPFSPQPTRSAAIGLAGGLLLALIIAFLLEQLDTRVRSEEQVVQALGLPVLGRIPRIARRDVSNGRLLVTLDQPGSPVAESFRMLRTNLDFVNVDGRVRSVLITSSAQGEGKSVCTCNLAVSLALSGKRVVLIDGDLRNPHVHIYLGLTNVVGLSHLLVHDTPPTQALQRVSLQPMTQTGPPVLSRSGRHAPRAVVVTARKPSSDREEMVWQEASTEAVSLYVLTSGANPPNPGELIASAKLETLIAEFSQHADVVLIDAPAMLAVGDTAALAARVDGLLYVVDANVIRRPMLRRAAEQLEQLPCRKFGLVIATDKADKRYGYHGRYYKADSRQLSAARK